MGTPHEVTYTSASRLICLGMNGRPAATPHHIGGVEDFAVAAEVGSYGLVAECRWQLASSILVCAVYRLISHTHGVLSLSLLLIETLYPGCTIDSRHAPYLRPPGRSGSSWLAEATAASWTQGNNLTRRPFP